MKYKVIGRLEVPDPRRSPVVAGENLTHDEAIVLAREMEGSLGIRRGAAGWWWAVKPQEEAI